jgi:CHASE2 domain-containing sensor protein
MIRKSGIFKVILTIVGAIVIANTISFVSGKVNVLEKFTIAINDLDFTDLYYQTRPRSTIDKNIVLVNIGYKDRSELAAIIKIISDHHPKVIGGDVFFDQEIDTLDVLGTEILSSELKSIDNLVLASAYQGKSDEGKDVIARQSPLIRKFVEEGIVNLNIATDDPEYGTVRSFKPVTEINGVKHLSFGFLVASFVDKSILPLANEEEMMIKWYGYGSGNRSGDSARVFPTFDWHQIQNGEFETDDFKDKVVLLGFMGAKVGDYVPEDIFFSPLNKKIIGRSIADMYGVEIHANIIKMILDRDFIFHSTATDILFNWTFIVILTLLLIWVHSFYPNQYSIVSKVLLIVIIDIFILGAIGIFSWTDGGVKFLISDGIFLMLFLPDTYEFLTDNIFKRWNKTTPVRARL